MKLKLLLGNTLDLVTCYFNLRLTSYFIILMTSLQWILISNYGPTANYYLSDSIQHELYVSTTSFILYAKNMKLFPILHTYIIPIIFSSFKCQMHSFIHLIPWRHMQFEPTKQIPTTAYDDDDTNVDAHHCYHSHLQRILSTAICSWLILKVALMCCTGEDITAVDPLIIASFTSS